jgi:hypothetical protein
MLTSPASNVSVPFWVVSRTLSNTAERLFLPATKKTRVVEVEFSKTPDATYVNVLEFSSVRVTLPLIKSELFTDPILNAARLLFAVITPDSDIPADDPEYPEFSMPPESPI